MTAHLGMFRPGSTIYVPFDTFAGSTGAPITLTGLATSDILIYKNGSVTQRGSTTGFTLLDTDGIDFDGITGIHGFSIDLSSNATANFYTAGGFYWIVVSTVTVDSQTMSFVAATFQIGYPDAVLNTTIATLSSQTSFTLTAGPAEDDALNGCVVWIHDIASAVQIGKAIVADYTGSTKTVTLAAGATFTVAAGDNISVFQPMLQPTVWGRTLDVSSGGEAGLDWANIGSPTTAQNLSGTNIDVDQVVASVSGAVGSVTGAVGSVTAQVTANVTAISGDATAADNAESFFDGTGYAGTNNVIPTVTTATNVTTVNGLAANVITAASIATNAIDADALAADAVTEIQSGLATAANLATVAGYLDTEIAAILADTNELQTDWVDGGRLDLILDARASQSSVDTLDNFVDTEIGAIITTLGTPAGASISADIAAIEAQTDDIGVAGAGLTALASAANLATVAADVWDVTLASHVGAGSTGAALNGATAPTAAAVADAVWDELLSGHLGAGSTGEALNAAGAAGDPWTTGLPGAYGAGSAGYIIGTNLDAAISTRASQSSLDTVDNLVDDLETRLTATRAGYLDNLSGGAVALQSSVDTLEASATAIEADTQDIQSKIGTPAGVSLAADIAVIESQTDDIGVAGAGLTALASAANLATLAAYVDTEVAAILVDTGTDIPAQLTTIAGYLDTEIAAIKAKTDNLPTDPADQSAVEAAITAATTGLATASALSTVSGLVDDLETRLSAARAGYLDNLSAGAVALQSSVDSLEAGVVLTNAGIDAIFDRTDGVETGYTLRQALRLMAAALAGELSGAATTTITIRNITDTKARITATVDSDGNRSALTLDAT